MGRKLNPKPDDAEQSKRFIDTAKDAEADDPHVLDRALKVIERERTSSPKK